MSNTVYIKGNCNVEVKKQELTLGDLVNVECSDENMKARLKEVKVLKMDEKSRRTVVSVLELIACIHKEYPAVEVNNLGETDIIVTYENKNTPPMYWHVIKVVLVVLITFVGSAFSIMTFHNDVDLTSIFQQIYQLFIGQKSDGFTILEAAYSIGLVIGILVFFNHFGKNRFTVDPTPIEVEMRMYENDIQKTLIEIYSRKGQEIDVDQTNSSGLRRS